MNSKLRDEVIITGSTLIHAYAIAETLADKVTARAHLNTFCDNNGVDIDKLLKPLAVVKRQGEAASTDSLDRAISVPRCDAAVLSDFDIKVELKRGNVFISPFDDKQLSNCSYDVTLGEHYYANDTILPYYNPWNVDHIHSYWGKPRVAKVATNHNHLALGLKPGDRYIKVNAGESILTHTNEFIGGRHHITAMMKARSSMGRSNVTVCKCAGWGDIGFINRWTMEVTNSGTCDVILPVGARVAQIVFVYSSKPIKDYQGKYQTSDDPDQLIRDWSPNDMLPKLNQEQIKA